MNTEIDKATAEFLMDMRHSPIRNYIVPGLTSWMIGGKHGNGQIRLFECSREQVELITPHSHRFDFKCLVLAGQVRNVIWSQPTGRDALSGDEYAITEMKYCNEPGKYTQKEVGTGKYITTESDYEAGDWYSMGHKEIHSIYFGRGAKVLFLEGPERTDTTYILEPHVDHKTIPTFKVEPWMFQREAQP